MNKWPLLQPWPMHLIPFERHGFKNCLHSNFMCWINTASIFHTQCFQFDSACTDTQILCKWGRLKERLQSPQSYTGCTNCFYSQDTILHLHLFNEGNNLCFALIYHKVVERTNNRCRSALLIINHSDLLLNCTCCLSLPFNRWQHPTHLLLSFKENWTVWREYV